jgi:hypothetical protein
VKQQENDMHKGATISKCGAFRYRLWRRWDEFGSAMIFVMLNPSTADADKDDPTIRKCIGFAERHGFGGIEILNLYAYRATKPADLKRAGWLVGPENDAHIATVVQDHGRGDNVVCAWGANARGMSRPDDVLRLLRNLGARPRALQFTTDGIPCHPLMLPYGCGLKYIDAGVTA